MKNINIVGEIKRIGGLENCIYYPIENNTFKLKEKATKQVKATYKCKLTVDTEH